MISRYIAGAVRRSVAAMMAVFVATGLNAQEQLAGARLLEPQNPALPEYLAPAIDAQFATTFVRITEAGRLLGEGVRCGPTHCRHRYSSTQAWNADQSLILIAKGCRADLCFLDGRTFAARFWRRLPLQHDCKWHPRDPETMICVRGGAIELWEPRTNRWTTAYRADGYAELSFGPYKGNPSRDGNRIAVRARDGRNELVAFVFDFVARAKGPDIRLSALEAQNQYVTVSPSGNYIYVAQLSAEGREPAYVFTTEGIQVQHWPEHHRPGHGDLTTDTDGEDVYVGISKAPPDKYHVISRRLIDGKVTVLAPYGAASHVSARNVDWPGWVFVTYQGAHARVGGNRYPAPFYREVVAMRIDGSGEIIRIASTNSAEHDYIAETHASPSPDGARVVWSSNWGEPGGPVSDFVTVVPRRQAAAAR